MRIKIYANYKKKEVISEAEFNDLIEELYKDKNDTAHFYTWLDNEYNASELWAHIDGNLNAIEKIRNTFEEELYEEVENELLMYEGWEGIEMEV